MRVRVIGVPMDLGQGRRGVDMGPSAIRAAGLHNVLTTLGHEVDDAGNVLSVEVESRKIKNPKLRYVDEVLLVLKRLTKAATKTFSDDVFPLVLGGDHSISIGTWAALASLKRNTALLWVDAHGDFNTAETTPSGNIHGMPLAALVGLGDERLVNFGGFAPKLKAKDTVLLGVRDLDPLERKNIQDAGIHYFTMRDIDERGIKDVMGDALEILARGGREFHVSFDVDVMDPTYALGTGTPSPGGLSYREAHLLMELVADTGRLGSLEFVEVNPLLDDRNKTGELAVGLIASALGKRII